MRATLSVVSELGWHARGGEHTLLEVELFHTGLVRRDGGTLDANRVLLDGLGGIEGDLILGLIAILESQIVVLEVDVQVREDELVLDVLPDDAGHLIAVQLDDGVLDLDLAFRGGSHGADRVGVYGTESRSGGGDARGGEAEGGGEQLAG